MVIEQQAAKITMDDFVGKGKSGKQIRTRKKYAMFIGIMSKPKMERIVYLTLAN